MPVSDDVDPELAGYMEEERIASVRDEQTALAEQGIRPSVEVIRGDAGSRGVMDRLANGLEVD